MTDTQQALVIAVVGWVIAGPASLPHILRWVARRRQRRLTPPLVAAAAFCGASVCDLDSEDGAPLRGRLLAPCVKTVRTRRAPNAAIRKTVDYRFSLRLPRFHAQKCGFLPALAKDAKVV